ncbi:hypothetical protein [Novosphingobium sp. KACC 22771]|uniref:hypothetical protein n=1 Tax=Novosphingobium sp. KACC 22771 TaxID=3025670 RepID=UPI0023667F44|nr:hypothetical protein [Novosphingobium sp. KACC 22771]WDF72867.1 hypothetical protein PQ467_02155 [Novosphingobium sp. KACC 22771]
MRSDMLVSVAVVDEEGPHITIPRLAVVARALEQNFRYFELIYLLRESQRPQLDRFAAEIAGLANLRIILTGEGTRFYRQRLIATMEAIGDVVALYDPDDMPIEDLVTQIGHAKDRDEILIGWRPSRPPSGWSYRLLSLASNNVISARAARTIILPREPLNAIAARKSASIDLRFEARNAPTHYNRFDITTPVRAKAGFSQRYELLMEILLAGAPRFLKLYAALGFLVVAGSTLYSFYAIAVILLRDHVQEGWFSTAIIQSGSTAFIAGGMSILAISLVAVLEVLSGGSARMIVDEISNTNFFDKVEDLNVEMSGDTPAIGEQHVA